MNRKIYKLLYQEGLKKYIDEQRIPFHMPGHKGKRLLDGMDQTVLTKNVYKYDITASYEREDLYNPQRYLKESLHSLQEIYQSKRSFYLVNGSTGGNQAALVATLNPGDKILLPRTVHKLIYGALVTTRAIPVYLEVLYYQNNPLLSGVDPSAIEAALKTHPDIKVVYLVNPTYTGMCSEILQIIETAHRYNKIVIVDEAHGAHFRFHPMLPVSATSLEADIVIQSAHKTLNTLSQTALLHVYGKRVDISRVEQAISMFQTSSPNTLLLLSLEAGVVQMANCGEEYLEKALILARYARESIHKIPSLSCLGEEVLKYPGIFSYDETKLYVHVARLGITGYEFKSLLGKKFKIEAELADIEHILFTITIADTLSDIKKLVTALKKCAAELKKVNPSPLQPLPGKVIPLATMAQLTPAEAFYAPHKDVSLDKAEGCLSAEMIVPYPPGIPIIMPGERISAELLEYMRYLIRINASFSGTKYKDLSKIVVVERSLDIGTA